MKLIKFLGIAIFSLLVLLPKLDSIDYYPGKYLWAEDGNVFINEAQKMGLGAVLNPYAGYLHLYPRLVMLLASQFSLEVQINIILIGWIAAYLSLILIAYLLFKNLKLKIISLIYFIILFTTQPNFGENYFNITNSQWLIGIILILIVIFKDEINFKRNYINSIILIVIALTGPYSIVVLPIIALKIILNYKNEKQNYWFYILIFACSIIQILFLLISERGYNLETNLNAWNWFDALARILFFGAKNITSLIAAIIFYIAIIYYSINYDHDNNNKKIMIVSSIFLFLISGLISVKNNPLSIAPIGTGTRYSWIPYTLIVFYMIYVTRKKIISQTIIFLLIFYICWVNYTKIIMQNDKILPYIKFSKYTDLIIPINPLVQDFPGWHVSSKKIDSTNDNLEWSIVNLKNIILSGAIPVNINSENITIKSNTNDPSIFLKDRINCPSISDIGIEISLNRNEGGWIQLFWSNDSNFSEKYSIKRWYPSGNVVAQFAFANDRSADLEPFIRIDPLETNGLITINNIKFLCIK